MKILNPITKFTVKRSEWLRGEGADASRLLRPKDGKMCCVGQYCIAAGATENEIERVLKLSDLSRKPGILTSITETIEKHDIYETNDAVYLRDPEREYQLTKKFAALGIAVTFED